jgi:hypothetical protein
MTAPQAMNLSFSTERLPERDRIAMWNEVFTRTIVGAETRLPAEGPFRCDATLTVLPGLAIASLAITAARCARTREMIAADGKDGFVLIVPVNGPIHVVRRDGDVIVDAGGMIVLPGTCSRRPARRSANSSPRHGLPGRASCCLTRRMARVGSATSRSASATATSQPSIARSAASMARRRRRSACRR